MSEEEKVKAKPGRKRKFPSQNTTERKKLCNSNQPYYNKKGELVEPVVFKKTSKCCFKNCYKEFDEAEQEKLFKYYHSLGSYELRTNFLIMCVKETEKKKQTTKNESLRKFSRTYTLHHKVVCKSFFVHVLQIGSNKIDRALKKMKTPEEIDDKRGRHTNHTRLSEEAIKAVHDHITSFQQLESRCRGKKSKMKYLDSDLTIGKMHKMFCEEWNSKWNYYSAPPGKQYYKKIFDKLNLKFKQIKNDTCKTCGSVFS